MGKSTKASTAMTADAAFVATGAELKAAAANGDSVAIAEQARRAEKRASKRTAATA